jgi:hypothetical protein
LCRGIKVGDSNADVVESAYVKCEFLGNADPEARSRGAAPPA